MKKINNYISTTIIALLLVSLIGCEKEVVYSCDPVVDSWVKENKIAIANFSREEIASYPINYQKPILRTLTSTRKKQLWQEKVDYILKLELSKDEVKVLQWYSDIFQKLDYSSNENSEYLQEEMKEKAIIAMKEFGWSKSFIYKSFFVIGDFEKYENISIENDVKNQNKGQGDCDCRYDMGCGLFYGDCTEGYCESEDDCGFFGNAECTGSCVEEDEQQQ